MQFKLNKVTIVQQEKYDQCFRREEKCSGSGFSETERKFGKGKKFGQSREEQVAILLELNEHFERDFVSVNR